MRAKPGIIFTMLVCSTIMASLAWGNNIFLTNNGQQNLPTRSIQIEHMPIHVDTIISTKIERLYRIEYGVRNLGNEPIVSIKWSLFTFGKDGGLSNAREWVDERAIEPNSSSKFSYSLIDPQGEVAQLVLVSQEVVTQTGRLYIDKSILNSFANRGFQETTGKDIGALYEPNIALSDTDKLDLYELILNHALKDKSALNVLHIEDPKHVFLKADEISDQTKSLAVTGVAICFIEGNKIQEKANRDGEIIYIDFYSTEVVGSNIWVTIESRKAVRAKTLFTPCCGGLKYRFHKELNGWKMQEVTFYNF